MIGPTLETDRLLLRPPSQEDFDGWAALMADEESSRYIGGPVERAASWRGLASVTGAWVLKGYSMFSVIEKATGQWIGRLGPWQPEEWPGTEVGWGLVRSAWGKGYATEGSARTIDWAFDELGWTDVIHCIDPKNAASIAVAERLGSRHREPGKLPAPFDTLPIEIWGQTREEWKSSR